MGRIGQRHTNALHDWNSPGYTRKSMNIGFFTNSKRKQVGLKDNRKNNKLPLNQINVFSIFIQSYKMSYTFHHKDTKYI